MTRRGGASKLGCLFTVLLAVAIAYFGVNIGEVYWRYYRYRDAMRQEARFGRQNSDDAIRRRLSGLADSLGLPEDAGRVKVVRTRDRISISAEYDELVELPLFVRTLHFAPASSAGL